MTTPIEKINRICPKCKAEERQMKKGFNRSGTQRYLCGNCGITYTPESKQREYSEETRSLAIKVFYSGVSGRGVGKVFGMSKANVYNWINDKAKKNGADCGKQK